VGTGHDVVMTLTMGVAPFGHRPAGRFNFTPPSEVVYVEPFPRRVRGVVGDETVVDSDDTWLVWVSRNLPRYSFPAGDVRSDAATPDPHIDGHVVVDWSAVDRWFEEDDEVFVHVRDPYHRIVVAHTPRHIVVSLNDVVLADTTSARALYETSLPTRWYVPREDVRMDLLEPSATITQCAYKGQPVHYSAKLPDVLIDDVAWSYGDDVLREAEDVRDHIAFYNERVDISVDDVIAERPMTPWSR
jgi:uncharacterized protein (DUF427 family)